MNLSSVLAALPKLSQGELVVVKSAVETLLKPTAGPDSTSLLFEVVSRYIVTTRMGFEVFKTTGIYKTWKRSAPDVVLFMEQTCPNLNRVETIAFASLLIEMLIADLKELNVPISLGTVVRNLSRVPQIFDVGFPMYRINGLAYLVISSITKGKK